MGKLIAILVLCLSFAPAAVLADENVAELDYSEAQVNDPLEPLNRAIFGFNSIADEYVMHPVASGYQYAVPSWGRQRVSNVFNNFGEPVNLFNSTIQGDPKNSFTSLWRFILNSSVGVLGTFDVASSFGLEPAEKDFGVTMGSWGYENPTYLVLPILGPSTTRDAVGMGVDYISNPLNIVMSPVQAGVAPAEGLDKRTNLLPVTDHIEKTSLDSYTTYRSYYLQNRENRINKNRSESSL